MLDFVTPEVALKSSKIPFKDNGPKQWYSVKCLFHSGESNDPEKWHGRIDPEAGNYSCFVCGTGGTVLDYMAAALNKPANVIEGAMRAAILGEKASLPQNMLEDYHNNLLGSKEFQDKLRAKHGINLESILKYKLGLKPGDPPRVIIPIFSDDGVCVNHRMYAYGVSANKMKGESGLNGKRLYLPENLTNGQTDVYIAEGEFKAILLNQLGFNAVASTGGAKGWEADWNLRFKGKHVIIVYDVDEAGRSGAAFVCRSLHGITASIRDVYLTDVAEYIDPATGKANGDITDYFVKKGKTVDDFRGLCIATTPYAPPAQPVEREEDTNVYDVELAETSNAKFNGKMVASRVVVSAKDTSPYIVPSKVQVRCNADQKYCLHCHVSTNPGYTFEIKADSEDILELVGMSKKMKPEVLKKISGVYSKCGACKFEELESFNVEELRVIPQIAAGHKTSEMVVRKVYYVGHGIDTNASYGIRARVVPQPQSQHATLVVYGAEPAIDDINEFRLGLDLSVFQPAVWTADAIEAKLSDLYEDLELNVTKIYKRRDLHLFYDLAWHSVLYIPFQGKLIKGWVDALCVGDSGQGKSECSSRLLGHYGTGERVDTKRSSVAGLVGGLQETNGRWFITWGTIPLNDRRLVLLEEIKGIPAESLSSLTDMRSSGVAEIQKIERAKTNARTRLVWISNPRSSRKLCEFNYGVDAVKELIGSLEDIRRFDMVIAVATGTVGLDVINATSEMRERCEHYYTADLCKHLVMWSWSRSENQVTIDRDAEHEILAAATRMGECYSSACPIVEPSDQRLKLLRLCAALAARTFSTDDGETLRIRKCHVEVVERFLDRLYSDRALGYKDYSLAQRGETTLRDPDEIVFRTKDMPNAQDSIQTLIEAEMIDDQLISNVTEWMIEDARAFIGFLVRKGALKKMRSRGYRKTAAFIDLLKQLDRQAVGNETLRDKDVRGEL
jgi:hypothetical protein